MRMTANIVHFVVVTLQSFSIVDSEEFKQLMEEKDAHFTLPCRQYLSKVPIPNKYEQLHKKINKMLQEAASVCDVCVTVDIWTNRQMRSYMGITAHFIQNWELSLVCLHVSVSRVSTLQSTYQHSITKSSHSKK